MESKPIVLIIVGIVAGAILGFGGGFVVYNSQIVDLKGSLTDTQLQFITLSSQYQVLSTQKDKLLANYTALSNQEKILTDSYSKLQASNQQLQSSYASLNTFLGGLTQDVSSLNATLTSIGFLPQAFSRTLNSQEIVATTSIVSNLDKSEPDSLTAYGNIYAYVTGFATSGNPLNYPYLQITKSVINGTSYISGFDTKYHEVYYRTPTETLGHHEGNSVDQAVLQYAMMMNYQQFIKKASQDTYLVVIDFQDGTHSGAVFVPSQNGLITVFDPSSSYMTHDFQISNQPSARIAASELGSYYNFYDSQKETIVNFTLYTINTVNGSVTSTRRGTLSDMIAFFS